MGELKFFARQINKQIRKNMGKDPTFLVTYIWSLMYYFVK